MIAVCLALLVVAPVHGQTPTVGERLAFAAFRAGQWDIYSIAPDGSAPRQLTKDAFEDTDPAYSPDGTKIAFASRRDNNWDVYVLDLVSGQETRLTTSPHYDGAPTWSPDGETLAYESYEAGNLDIWLVDAAGNRPATNLTGNSPAGDFGPAWSPDGQVIAFTSWRDKNKELYLLNLAPDQTETVTVVDVTRLTNTPEAEEWPVWQPGGDRLAFVGNDLGDRELFMMALADQPATQRSIQPVTWLGRTDGPAWSPDGTRLAAFFHRWDGTLLMVQAVEAAHQLPVQLTDVMTVQGRLTWHSEAVDYGWPIVTPADVSGKSSLYEEQLTFNGEEGQEPYNLVRQNDLIVGTPWLADTVDDSFQAWRVRLRDEVGYDFLHELSDASRDVGQYSKTSQYASWHKSGRAIDTLFDYHLGGQLAHEIVREDYSGDTYWRVYLRCVDQSGRCGRPMTANPWNYSARARTQIAPEQGGLEKEEPASGYYVDMTALAHEYGWERISSYDDKDYSWTWHFLAFEYWHYQKPLTLEPHTGVTTLNWYRAMRDIYPQRTLDKYFTWSRMRKIGDDPYLIALKGVPLPLEAKPWWNLIEP